MENSLVVEEGMLVKFPLVPFVTCLLHHSPPPLLQLRTRIIVHAQTAAQQQSNGSYESRMSGKCGEWRDSFIMTLSPIHWVPVQDKGSKILCVKLGAMKVTPRDPLHQEYLIINIENTSDRQQLHLLLVRLCETNGQQEHTGVKARKRAANSLFRH